MKDYNRLTERDEFGNAEIIGVDSVILATDLSFDELNKLTSALNRLADLEDKIERGELISTVQSEQGEQEIAYFVKHNAAVRKQAVKEFSDKILSISKITFSAFTDAKIELSLAEYKQLIKEVCGE